MSLGNLLIDVFGNLSYLLLHACLLHVPIT